MARRRKRKLNVKVAVLLVAVVGVGLGGWQSYKVFMRYTWSKHPQVFQKALDLVKAGDRQGAVRIFDKAIANASTLKDDDASVKYRQAEIVFLSDWYRSDKTLTEEKRASILDAIRSRAHETANILPDDTDALRRYAQAYWDSLEERGGVDEMIKAAETYLAKMKKKGQDDPEVRRWVAQAHALLAPGKPDQVPLALKAFEEAVTADPADVETYVDWASLLEQLQRPPQEVMAIIRRGATANPNSARLQALLARLIVLQEHDRTTADQYFAHAMDVPDKNMEDWVAIGHYYLLRVADTKSSEASAMVKDADPNKAIEAFSQAIQGNPENAAVYLQLADLHHQAGRLAQAEEVLQSGLKAFEARRGDLTVNQMAPREKRTYVIGTFELRAELAKMILLRKSEYGDQWPAKLAEARQHVAYVTQQLEQMHRNMGVALKLQGHLALVEADNNEKLVVAEKLLRNAYDQLASQQRTDPEIVTFLIQIYQRQGQYGEARKLIDKLLNAYPDSLYFTMLAARMDMYFGKSDSAEPYIRKLRARERDLTDEQRFELVRMEQATSKTSGVETPMATIPERITEPMVPKLLAEAQSFHGRRMNEQAIAICTAILKQYPQHEDTRLLRVAIYLFEQDMDGARQCLDEGIALNPQSQALLYQKNLLDSKTPEDRRQLRVEYLTKVYQGAELERQLSELYEQFPDPNDPGAALAHLEKAVELDPSNLLVTRKLFYTELIRKDENGKHIGFEKAEAVMEKAKVFGPDETDLMRAGMLKEKGNNDPTTPEFKEAIGIMKDALARHETFSEGHAVLGELYLDSRNLQEARTQLNRSYELNPTQVGALINLARLAALENRPEDHEKWINLAWRYAPNDAYVRNNWLAYQERHAATNDQINALIQYGEQLASRDTQDVENWGRLARLYMKADPPRREAAGQIYAELYRNFQGKEPRGCRPGSLQFLELYLSYLRLTDQAPAGLQKLEEVADKEPDKVGYFVVYGNYLAALGNTDKALESFNAALAKDSNDRRPYLAKSLVQIDLKNWDGAVSTLRDGVRALPDERDMKVMLVNVLLQSEQFESARQAAAEMTKANPNDMGALVLEGRALQLAGHIDEARAKYDKVLTSNPNAGEALRFRAWTFIATGQFAAAVKDLVALSHVRPDPATVSEIARIQVMMKDLDGAKATLEEGLTVHENNPQIRQALVNVLILQSSQNSLEAAEAELHKGQEHDPNSSVFWMQEADMWRQRKEVDAPTRRVTALQKARGLSPNNPTVFIEYIDGLLDAGRFEELKQLSKEIKDPPPIIAIMMQVALGRAYLGTNNEADAANCFRQAYLACQGDEIGAVDSRVRKALGDQKLGDQKLVALLRQWLTEQDNWCMRLALARILRDSPDTRAQAAELLAGANLEGATNLAKMLVYQDLGTTLQDLKRTEEARKAYEAALALPDVKAPSLRATALNNLAYVLADDLNQPKQAVDFARQAMQLMPQSTDIMDTVGWSYYRAGQLNQAEHYLLQAIELTPSASYRYHLGMVQEAKGNKEEALRQYRLGFETVRDNPNDEQHRKIKERLAALGAP